MYINILITGASSGIGRALALEFSKPNVNLFLCARNETRLNQVKDACEKLGAKIYTKILDIKNENEIKDWINNIENSHNLDLIIANAGVSAGTSDGIESVSQIKEIFDTNIYGVLNTINPAIFHMKNRRSGQIVIISSLAGFKGLPSSPAYSASKAAVRVYGEALRGNLQEYNIKVNVVCPGYVKTPMTKVNEFPMPFLMGDDKCAKKIIKNIKKNKSRISFPFPLFFTVWLMTLLSNKITDPIFAKLPKKKSF